MNKFQTTSVCAAIVALAWGASGERGDRSELGHTLVAAVAWNELPDGRATARIHGEMTTGEHLSYVRFPAGLRTAPHSHSAEYFGIVVKGRARHFEPMGRVRRSCCRLGLTMSSPAASSTSVSA